MTAEQEAEVLEHPDAQTEGATPEEIEADARRQGWRPKDEYKGTKPWVDAAEYLKNGETIQPILRKTLKQQEKKIDELNTLIRDMVTNQRAEQERAVKNAIAALQVEKRAAVSEGDVARVEAIDGKIEEAKAAVPAKLPPVAQIQVSQEFIDWGERNPWFGSNKKMRALAIEEFGDLEHNDDTAHLTDAEKLRRVTAEVRRRFPEAFGTTQRRNEAAQVEGGNPAPRRNGSSHTWADLPADAKPIAERVIASVPGMTKEKYLKDYPW